jgi:hypothetical protein
VISFAELSDFSEASSNSDDWSCDGMHHGDSIYRCDEVASKKKKRPLPRSGKGLEVKCDNETFGLMAAAAVIAIAKV